LILTKIVWLFSVAEPHERGPQQPRDVRPVSAGGLSADFDRRPRHERHAVDDLLKSHLFPPLVPNNQSDRLVWFSLVHSYLLLEQSDFCSEKVLIDNHSTIHKCFTFVVTITLSWNVLIFCGICQKSLLLFLTWKIVL